MPSAGGYGCAEMSGRAQTVTAGVPYPHPRTNGAQPLASPPGFAATANTAAAQGRPPGVRTQGPCRVSEAGWHVGGPPYPDPPRVPRANSERASAEAAERPAAGRWGVFADPSADLLPGTAGAVPVRQPPVWPAAAAAQTSSGRWGVFADPSEDSLPGTGGAIPDRQLPVRPGAAAVPASSGRWESFAGPSLDSFPGGGAPAGVGPSGAKPPAAGGAKPAPAAGGRWGSLAEAPPKDAVASGSRWGAFLALPDDSGTGSAAPWASSLHGGGEFEDADFVTAL